MPVYVYTALVSVGAAVCVCNNVLVVTVNVKCQLHLTTPSMCPPSGYDDVYMTPHGFVKTPSATPRRGRTRSQPFGEEGLWSYGEDVGGWGQREGRVYEYGCAGSVQ